MLKDIVFYEKQDLAVQHNTAFDTCRGLTTCWTLSYSKSTCHLMGHTKNGFRPDGCGLQEVAVHASARSATFSACALISRYFLIIGVFDLTSMNMECYLV